MNPAVSVVVPTFNYGHYLAGALRSVLGQTFRDLEVLVIDDGSTDGTAAVVAPFLRDDRLRYLSQVNQGPAAARNLGIEQARTPLVAFLDADDRWLPTKLEKQLTMLDRQRQLGMVYCRRLWIDETDDLLDRKEPVFFRGWVLPQLFRNNFVCFSSTVFRRQALLRAGGFDQLVEHAEDYDLLLRVTRRYPVDYVNEPLVLYRTGHCNLSSQTEKRFVAICGIMRRFLQEDGCMALPPRLVRQAWAETYCHWGHACRELSWLRALRMQLRALGWVPWLGEAWQGLASLCVSRGARQWLRRFASSLHPASEPAARQGDLEEGAELAYSASDAPLTPP
jgi:glycosyltransferase involved in cell wall biosynthesis